MKIFTHCDIALNNEGFGICGIVKIAIIEKHDAPVQEIKILAVSVNVDGVDYTLDKRISIIENEIRE